MKINKATFVFLFAFPVYAQAQEAATLSYNQGIANCENKWSGFKDRDGKTQLGYVYVDPSAGFTFELYGKLESTEGHIRAIKSELHGKARVIVRIEHNFPAMCLSESQVAELGLPLTPEWMKFYKDDRPLPEHHTRWAYHANHIGANELALAHIAKVVAAGAASPSLIFENAFALNALRRFDETIALLAPAIASNGASSDLIAELAFAHLAKGDFQTAIVFYKRAIDHDKPSVRRSQFANNTAYAYGKLGDHEQSDHWAAVAVKYKEENPDLP